MSESFDVVVVGSGVAALTAAISAAEGGAKVVLLERAAKIGGTTAYSGGMSWVPGTAHFVEIQGHEDSRDDASRYIRGLVKDRFYDVSLVDTFLDEGPKAVEFVQRHSPLRLHASTTYTDYFANRDGGVKGGRSLVPEPFPAREQLGKWFDQLQESPHFPVALTLDEMVGGAGADPRNANLATMTSTDLKERAEIRNREGIVANGSALVGALLAGSLKLGVDVRTGWRMTRLTGDADGVTGVAAEHDGVECELVAARGVVLACGGFEWNADLVLNFMGTVGAKPLSTPYNIGDALIAGQAIGAATANMTYGWNYPATWDPSRTYNGYPMASIQTPRFEPGCVAVNSQGKRFVNEGAAYADVGKAFPRYDELAQAYPNCDGAWFVFDQTLRDRVVVADLRPGEPSPGWVAEAATLSELAAELGIPADAFEATVADFNAGVDQQVDPAYGRGTLWFEGQTKGGPGPEKALGRIERGPFYAMGVYHGLLGTAGGLWINGDAQVLSVLGQPIPGLYAAGNSAASPFGGMYPGGGTTLGLGLTFGYIAGRALARG